MKYSVGTYVIVPPKPFSSKEEAVRYIQEKYPELDKETIEKHLKPSVNGNDKSGNVIEENSISPEAGAKASPTIAKGVKPSADKSR